MTILVGSALRKMVLSRLADEVTEELLRQVTKDPWNKQPGYLLLYGFDPNMLLDWLKLQRFLPITTT